VVGLIVLLVDDLRLGAALRAMRLRRGWRQSDLAQTAGLSHGTVSLIERGHVADVTLDTVRSVAAALDARVEVLVRWRGADVDRLLGARHSAMHETLAQRFASMPGWIYRPEVSFSHFGERGVIDGLACHAATRTLIVIELKTELVDVQELIGSVDRKRRLAVIVARSLGWIPEFVGVWLVVADSRTNHRHVARHRQLLAAAFPHRGTPVTRWLRDPTLVATSFRTGPAPRVAGASGPAPRVAGASGPIEVLSALTYMPYSNPGSTRHDLGPVKRVRTRTGAPGPTADVPTRAGTGRSGSA
jgi:HTH-type transcriptional regulator / antitoxin HipB